MGRVSSVVGLQRVHERVELCRVDLAAHDGRGSTASVPVQHPDTPGQDALATRAAHVIGSLGQALAQDGVARALLKDHHAL